MTASARRPIVVGGLCLALVGGCGESSDSADDSAGSSGASGAAGTGSAAASGGSMHAGAAGAGPTSADGGAAGTEEIPDRPAPGTYMGFCTGPESLQCDEGLRCVQSTSFVGGTGTSIRYCTHSCDEGCPPPSPGCGSLDVCAPPG